MKKWLVVFLLIQISCVNRSAQEEFQLQKGDFLFQDLDSSPICDAIELVTPGYKGANLSHIGMVVELGDPYCINPDYNYNDHVKVLEALPNKVRITSINSFLNRSFDDNNNPKVIVGRLKAQHSHTIQNAISFSRKKIGMNYDDLFILNNDQYYCSELIYDAFLEDSIFQLQNMNFLHPDNGDTLQAWIDYYSELEIEIQHNTLGIIPGVMSLSDKIEIVHIYGIPEGMKR